MGNEVKYVDGMLKVRSVRVIAAADGPKIIDHDDALYTPFDFAYRYVIEQFVVAFLMEVFNKWITLVDNS